MFYHLKVKENEENASPANTSFLLHPNEDVVFQEFAFLKALADRGFPVPRPVDVCRHLVVMGLVEGRTLCHIDHVEDVGALYDR